jgi:hypothetical protein
MTDPAMTDLAHLDAAGATAGDSRFPAERSGTAVLTAIEIG